MKGSAGILEDILAIEAGTSRMEGAFLADPELGLIWRSQAALTEACRSVSLEDISVREGDVATRPLRSHADDYEAARGAWFAGELLKVILSPGDIFKDPERAVKRCLRSGIRPTGSEEQIGTGDEDLYRAISESVRNAPGPVVGSLRAALTLRTYTASASPSAERLMMMCADHSFRDGRSGREIEDMLPEGIGLSADAGGPRWILLPSTALTTDGFKIWSPGSSQGFDNILEGLRRETGRGLGSLPVLRRWKAEARSLSEGKRSGARIKDLVNLVSRRPILIGSVVSEALTITPRSALNLLNEATESGILEELTRRRSYRAWAATPMAQRIRMPEKRGDHRAKMVDKVEERFEEDLSGEEAALAQLDDALAQADRILSKYGAAPRQKRIHDDFDDG